MDVGPALSADLAAKRFERERSEAAKHKPHVLAPEDISTDVASETSGHVDRSKAKDPREERKGKPANSFQGQQAESEGLGQCSSSDQSDGEHHLLDVRV